jgi:hypothetical protein
MKVCGQPLLTSKGVVDNCIAYLGFELSKHSIGTKWTLSFGAAGQRKVIKIGQNQLILTPASGARGRRPESGAQLSKSANSIGAPSPELWMSGALHSGDYVDRLCCAQSSGRSSVTPTSVSTGECLPAKIASTS